jgi:hypothetical protein
MGLNLKPTSGKDFGELVPEGDYFAVCVGVIDLGTHTPIRGFQGAAPTAAHKVYIAWELADYTGNPVVGKDFTASLNEKAKLRAWVKKWRGRDFGEQEEFQLSKLVGQKCQLTISHTRSGERTFANVEELTKLRSTDKVPDATRELITFDLDSGKAVYVPDWMPWLYGRPLDLWVETCEERAGKKPSEGDNHREDTRKEAVVAGKTLDDEVPFSVLPFVPWIGLIASGLSLLA